jgi:DNA repair protein RecN (Recombination protein N)
MITEIYIRDLGVIREARLNFKPGLNVLTGETGAGKTMVLSALALLLGGRADSGSVRAGSNSAFVEGRWSNPSAAVVDRIVEAGCALDEGQLLANRSVSAEGKSRAAISGVSVPVGLLAELGEHLVVVHGQSDQIRLKSSTAQRQALDSFAALEVLLSEYRSHFDSWRDATKLLAVAEQNRESSAAELSRLLADLEEIEVVSPRQFEDTELSDISARMSNVEALRNAAATAHEALSSDLDQIDVRGLLASATRALEQQGALDSSLAKLAESMQEIGYQAAELASQLSSYVASLEADSEMSFDQVQNRLAQLNALIRKHGASLEDVFAYSEFAAKRVVELDGSDEKLDSLRATIAAEFAVIQRLAEQLTVARTSAALALAAEVNAELKGLAMAAAEFVVQVQQVEEFTPEGKDAVTFLLKSYAGAEPRPIAKNASGGELSRIMLALEVVLAKGSSTPTFIFDEVDAGVGGAAAIEVGKRLARLSRQAQVIVITHLAQVAAFADSHQRVLKTQNGDISESDVADLSGAERESELARMLSGLADSSSALEHAAELVTLAKTAKNS